MIFGVTPIFGQITPVTGGYKPDIEGITALATNILRLAFLAAGIWAFFNFIIAGYNFLSAGGDPKNVANAWNKIWQTILGLVIMVASFILAAVFGYLVFGDPLFILQPQIYGP